jgi:hypothetical protein
MESRLSYIHKIGMAWAAAGFFVPVMRAFKQRNGAARCRPSGQHQIIAMYQLFFAHESEQ